MAVSKVYNMNAFDGLLEIPDSSVDAIITDPPYFIDGHKDDYDEKTTGRKTTKNSNSIFFESWYEV